MSKTLSSIKDNVGLGGSLWRLGGTASSEAEQPADEAPGDEGSDRVNRLEDLMQVKLGDTSTWLRHTTTTLCEHRCVGISDILEAPDEEAREASEAGEEGLKPSSLTGSISIAKAEMPTQCRSKHVD